jgi:hypothetical protein
MDKYRPLFIGLAISIIIYLAFIVGTMEVNPVNWKEDARGIFAVFIAVVLSICIIINFAFKDK